MKKLLISIIGLLATCPAFAAGENIATSKAFVDAGVAQKQDAIPANNGTAAVLTNTGVAGEIGIKNIYDSNNSYAAQRDALVTAGDFNTAVQNAIDTEFECVAWRDPNNHNSDCMLVQIRGVTENHSPNLFDISKVPNIGTIVNNGDGSITARGQSNNRAQNTGKKLSELAPDLVVGKTYTFSFESESANYFTLIYNLSTRDYYHWRSGTSLVMTQHWLDSKVYFQTPTNEIPIKIWNVQIEEGSVATPYQPYGENNYMPNGN